jgi:hypothetical protein
MERKRFRKSESFSQNELKARSSNLFHPFTLVLIALVIFGEHTTAIAQTLRQILNNGPRLNRFNIVIFSEGYTSAELTSKFPADARRLLNVMFQAPPYKEYKPFFNAFTIAVASAQSGSDHPSMNIHRNTYFNSTYDSFGTDRLLTIPPNDFDQNYDDGQGRVFDLLANLLPDYDVVFMLVNDPVYGGSGGPVAITSLAPSASEILIHESGHTLAALGDEYDSSGGTPFEAPNVTQQTNRSLIRWHSWIAANTPIPTPETTLFGTVIGLFQGAAYNTTGWYRPKLDCKMNHLSVPFCSVCSEALVLSFEEPLSLIDHFVPVESTVFARPGSQLNFSITKLRPVTHSLTTQWFLDGTAITGATNDNLTLSAASLGSAHHVVTAMARDFTALVRNDPSRIQRDTHVWTIAGPPGPFDFDGDGRTDYVLYNAGTQQTAVWYLNNNVYVSGATGPTLPAGWSVVGVADFNGDGHPDYLLFNSATRATAIWYMNNNVRVGGRVAQISLVARAWSLLE